MGCVAIKNQRTGIDGIWIVGIGWFVVTESVDGIAGVEITSDYDSTSGGYLARQLVPLAIRKQHAPSPTLVPVQKRDK